MAIQFIRAKLKRAFSQQKANTIKTLLAGILIAFMLCGCGAHQASPFVYWGAVPNEENLDYLKHLGFKAVINLRTNSHKGRSEYAERNGLKFFHIKTGVVKTPEEAELKKFIGIVADPKNHPVFISCNIGIDRTSYYLAAYRIAVEGWTVKQALLEARVHGLKQWWPTFREYEDSLRSNEAMMRRVAGAFPKQHIHYDEQQLPCPCKELNKHSYVLIGEYKKEKEAKVTAKLRALEKKTTTDSESQNKASMSETKPLASVADESI
ncbi:MAG: hypothetical protein K2X77_08430 [Candidatus Obscuribacterales bacterium]|nr:hypothetical protein [Candidatus Obscuribacterales bacterium]